MTKASRLYFLSSLLWGCLVAAHFVVYWVAEDRMTVLAQGCALLGSITCACYFQR